MNNQYNLADICRAITMCKLVAIGKSDQQTHNHVDDEQELNDSNDIGALNIC